MSFELSKYIPWLDNENVRPYILSRPKNIPEYPGTNAEDFDWFRKMDVVVKNPFHVDELEFSDLIMDVESRAFHEAGMAMPRWVFFDCAIMPGFVAGFAHRTSTLPEAVKKAIGKPIQGEWTPISLFITIPTQRPGEWVAHNLMSINSILQKSDQFYGLGFLSKAFGLWYGNIEKLCGMTQWGSPALKLHCHYGDIKMLTAYTPVHSHAKTITYQCNVNPYVWESFFTKEYNDHFNERFEDAGVIVDHQRTESLLSMQKLLEENDRGYYLSPEFIRKESLQQPIPVFVKK